MAEELRLRVTDTPTIFNKEMAIGTLLFPGLLGTIIGGLVGKERMEWEFKDGRRVSSDPSFWNKDTLLGGLIGYSMVAIIGMITAVFAFPEITILGLAAIGVGSGAVGTVIGAWVGGKHGQDRMEHEYRSAVVQQVSQNASPEVAQAVEHAMEHKKDWGKKILEEKLLATGREQGV
jgi:hypothetical protein